MCAWIWMKCCVSTDVGTWTNWWFFEPDLDYSPDVGTGLRSLISLSAATWNFMSGKSDVYVLAAAAKSCFNIVLFSEPSKHLCCMCCEQERAESTTSCEVDINGQLFSWWNGVHQMPRKWCMYLHRCVRLCEERSLSALRCRAADTKLLLLWHENELVTMMFAIYKGHVLVCIWIITVCCTAAVHGDLELLYFHVSQVQSNLDISKFREPLAKLWNICVSI